MSSYESPRLATLGGIVELTQGQAYSPGQDNLSWVPTFGHLFGGDDYTGPGFGS